MFGIYFGLARSGLLQSAINIKYHKRYLGVIAKVYAFVVVVHNNAKIYHYLNINLLHKLVNNEISIILCDADTLHHYLRI